MKFNLMVCEDCEDVLANKFFTAMYCPHLKREIDVCLKGTFAPKDCPKRPNKLLNGMGVI